MGPWTRHAPGQRGVYGIFINHQGQRKAKKVGDKKAAETTAIRAGLAKGTFKLPQTGMGFATMAEEWLTTYLFTHKLGANTVENYTSVVGPLLFTYADLAAILPGGGPVSHVDLRRRR